MNIGQICTREVVMVERDATLQHAATLMREQHVGALLVTAKSEDNRQVVAGIVTDRDIVIEAVARGLDPAQAPIGRLAEGKLAVISAGASIDQAIALMRERGVRRLLVSSDGGQLYGIASLDDLLAAVSHEMAELAASLRKGIDGETRERGSIEPAAPPPQAIHIPVYSYT